MKHVRFCILGAGPSGLAFAAGLKQAGCDSFLLIEKEAEAGGLCRSAEVDGAPLDIGGGHFLDLRRSHVLDFLFQYLPQREWETFDRISTIRLHGVEVEHPLEGNLWQLPLPRQVDYLESIARTGSVQGAAEPGTFDEWIRWKLGDRIAEDYMLPYNRKMWSMPLRDLATDWIYKLPAVSLRESLQSCLEQRSGGRLPAHGRFLYPRSYGYGEVWRRIAASLGDRFLPGYALRSIDLGRRLIDDAIRADVIVTTIPWTVWPKLTELPETIRMAIDKLVYTTVHVDYCPESLPSRSHWIYEPNEECAHHRLLLRHNFLGGARGHWLETNARRAQAPKGPRFVNEYAYPVSTVGRAEGIACVLDWAGSQGVMGLGRWGSWEHINSDVAVENALLAARKALAT